MKLPFPMAPFRTKTIAVRPNGKAVTPRAEGCVCSKMDWSIFDFIPIPDPVLSAASNPRPVAAR
jgi:hypothetical protein